MAFMDVWKKRRKRKLKRHKVAEGKKNTSFLRTISLQVTGHYYDRSRHLIKEEPRPLVNPLSGFPFCVS